MLSYEYERCSDSLWEGVIVDLAAGTTGGAAGTDAIDGFEQVKGSSRADLLSGDDQANLLIGLGWDDELAGGAGDDTADGGSGIDTCEAETELNCEN
jgi:Ca2+-binding RTX toxin-like protein